MDNLLLEKFNSQLRLNGMLEVAFLKPSEIQSQPKNARYFDNTQFKQLVANIASAGHLEGVILVRKRDNGAYECVSGHNRRDAAKEAGIEEVMCLVLTGITDEETTAKQLAHNALVGKDDMGILKELFDSIKDIELKLSTGLQSEIERVTYQNLQFKSGATKSMMLLFFEEDFEATDEMLDKMVSAIQIDGDSVRVARHEHFDKIAAAIRKIKKVQNIKNNAVAFETLLSRINDVL